MSDSDEDIVVAGVGLPVADVEDIVVAGIAVRQGRRRRTSELPVASLSRCAYLVVDSDVDVGDFFR